MCVCMCVWMSVLLDVCVDVCACKYACVDVCAYAYICACQRLKSVIFLPCSLPYLYVVYVGVLCMWEVLCGMLYVLASERVFICAQR